MPLSHTRNMPTCGMSPRDTRNLHQMLQSTVHCACTHRHAAHNHPHPGRCFCQESHINTLLLLYIHKCCIQ